MTETVPRVSIVLPVFNAAQTLEATLRSLWLQSFRDFEVVAVNDGSTDGTGRILARQHDPRLRVFDAAHGGVSASRNRGIREARGEFVAFIDGDDLWTADKLERQVAALDAAPGAALAYSWTDQIDGAGRVIQRGSHVRAEGMVYPQLAARNFLDCGSTPLVRRGLLLEAGPFDETLRGGEDWDLWLRIAHRHAFACVPAVQVHYRVHADSAVSKPEQQVRDVLTVIGRAVERLPPSPERELIARTATANLYKYIAVRLCRTARSRADGVAALGYLGQYVRTTPELLRNLGKILLIFLAAASIALLAKKVPDT